MLQMNILVKSLFTHSLFFNLAVQAQNPPSKKAVVHLKHMTTDLHAVKMALSFANGFLKAGADTTLVLSLEGVRLVDKNQPITMTWGLAGPAGHMGATGKQDTIETSYEDFVKNGGKVLVCPGCSKAAGCELKQLRNGAKIAPFEDIAKVFLEADTTVDY
jgi:predicted peroxiredoxin